jgi:transcriptional/translational regulatory protein YebC/TACO1
VELSKQGEEDLEAFLEKMDENEDVNNVYHNAA